MGLANSAILFIVMTCSRASLAKYFGHEDVAKYIDRVEKMEETEGNQLRCEEFKDNSHCNANDLMNFF